MFGVENIFPFELEIIAFYFPVASNTGKSYDSNGFFYLLLGDF